MTLIPLDTGWTVTAISGDASADLIGRPFPAAVPGCAHTDLLTAGVIVAPFDADNEAAHQWIGSTVWQYKTEFQWSDDGSQRHDLVALGLDTVATIELNGAQVAQTQNQFRSYRFDVGALIVEGRNTLTVTFAAPVTEAEARSAEHGLLPHTNHHPYNALRKMACNFGWDWGIDVATSGIWKPIGIDSWSGARIASVRPLVGLDGVAGVLDTHVELEWAKPGPATASLTVEVDGITASASIQAPVTEAHVHLSVPEVRTWWPVGHGAQPLYDVNIDLRGADAVGGSTHDAWKGRVGFRTVELDTTPDAAGTPFIIKVNGEPIAVRGGNWIPDHAFLTEMDADRYARRVDDALEANMNLLRVWGGGIYESDDFYDACDERGILVWQDFLFACAAYAEELWLAEEVEAEAREAITRLSVHPSLVIWNGNNENFCGYGDGGWRPLLAGRTWGNGYYRELLPRLLHELDPGRPYSPGSPYSFTDYLDANDQRNGTIHIWDVWNRRDYSAYQQYRPRFVSEFGFQGPPAWSTLVDVVHDEPLDPYGHEMLVHQKADRGNLKLAEGLESHLPTPATIEDWHWATQLNQASAVRFGIEHFRSLTPHNMGMIVWQLNDNWPVVSWAAVDFNEIRKPLWYALRSAYAPRLATFQPREAGLALVLVNDTAEAWAGSVLVAHQHVDGTTINEDKLEAAVAARSATTIAVPASLANAADPATEILVAELTSESGFAPAVWNFAEILGQRLDPDPLEIEAAVVDVGFLVTVHAHSYVRDLTLQADRVDPQAKVDKALVTLRAGQSASFTITSRAKVEASEFVSPLVLRSGNGLLASARN
jgi:beta-mannosidase